MANRRVAFSMTVDPEGAMHDWVDLPAGWSLTRIPTQEAVLAVGIPAYQRLLVDVCARERPHLLITHPPYDYLTAAVAHEIRAHGTRVVGYAFDDEIFAGAYTAATRAALAQVYDRYVTTSDVLWATRPTPPLDIRPPDIDVVLVGRAYPRRVALVESLRAAGRNVVARGEGWPGGQVPRATLLDLYRRAAIVLTVAGWEEGDVAMVKHRLLETAMLGAFQLAQDVPDLRRYFTAEEVPGFTSDDDALAKVAAFLADPPARTRAREGARARCLAEHTWNVRFASLTDGVSLRAADDPPAERSALLDQLLLALATRAEIEGRVSAAAALFGEVVARDPDDATGSCGLGRCLRDLGDLAGSLPHLRRAAAAPTPPAAAALTAALNPGRTGTGLGRLGLMSPAAEPNIFLVAALIELGHIDDAVAAMAAIADTTVGRVVAAALKSDEPLDPRVEAALDRLR